MECDRFTLKGFTVWSICAIFFLYEFFLRTVLGTFQEPLMQDLHLSSLQFSLISSTLFLLMYGSMQIPVGLIVENIGLKKSLLCASFLCAIASFGLSSAQSFPLAICYRMLMGFGAAFGFIGLLISVHEWMPKRHIALFIGLSQFIGTLGPMLAAGPLDALASSSHVTWRVVFVYLGVFGACISFLVFCFVEGNQNTSGKYLVLSRPEKVLTSIRRLFSRPQAWCIAILSAMLYFAVEYLSENEGRSFLSLKGIPLGTASYMISISWVGYAVGSPLLGWLSDRLQRRKSILLFSIIVALFSVIAILYVHQQTLLQTAFFFLGFSASAQSVSFATIAEQFKQKFVAIGFGLNNTMITLVSAINAPLIGWMLDHTKQGCSLALGEYCFVFNLLILNIFIALILAIFWLKETYCKSAVDLTYIKRISSQNNS